MRKFHNLGSKEVLKFEFCKNQKMRIYQLIPRPETYGNQQANTFKTIRKELQRFIISGRKRIRKELDKFIISGRKRSVEIWIRKSDEMRIYQLVFSPETHEKKSSHALQTVRKRIRNGYNLRGEIRGEIRISQKW